MALTRNLLPRRLHSLLDPQNVSFVYHIIYSTPPHSHKIPPSHHRSFASSSQTLAESDRTHGLKSLHSLFQEPPERRRNPKNEKLKGKLKQGQALGLLEKTGAKGSEVGRVNDVENKPPEKKLRKSGKAKVNFIQKEEEGELHGKPKQGKAGSSSEKTERKKSEVQPVEDKRKKPKKKIEKPKKWKVKFIEEEEEEVIKGEQPKKPDPKKLKGKLKQGQALGLLEKTGAKGSEVGRVNDVENKPPEKKLRKSGKAKVNFIQKEEEGELHVKPKQGKAGSSSEKTERKKSEVQPVEDKRKKPKKKIEKPKKWKVKFIEEEEEEVIKGEQPKKPDPKRLYDLFSQGEKSNEANSRRLSPGIASVETYKEVKQREPVVLKKLSLDMETFLSHLYKEGYFRDANFVKGKNFDLSWFDNEYARGYILSVVQKFGKDKQEISKWLSGSDLKQVAMFGCPSANKSQVFPSKRLRCYFKIPENSVCNGCVLRDSCKFVNQSVWGPVNNNLDLAMAMKVICSYAMSLVHHQLVVPDKVNTSVTRLLKEVLKLSQTL